MCGLAGRSVRTAVSSFAPASWVMTVTFPQFDSDGLITCGGTGVAGAIIGFIWICAAVMTLPWLVVFRQDSISDTLVCCVHGFNQWKNKKKNFQNRSYVYSCARKNGRIPLCEQRLLRRDPSDAVLRRSAGCHRPLLRLNLPNNLAPTDSRKRCDRYGTAADDVPQ